jgi:hypothetical protein
MAQSRARTTVVIPPDLLEAVDRAVLDGLAESRNEFLALALRNQLVACRRATIDAAFVEMVSDLDYQRESLELTRAFETADASSDERSDERTWRRAAAKKLLASYADQDSIYDDLKHSADAR